MIVGMYCNWGVVRVGDKYYLPSIHKKYIDIICGMSGCVYLLSKTKSYLKVDSDFPQGYELVTDASVKFINLPYFKSYLNSIFFLPWIIKGLFKLTRSCDFVYIRTPEPFSWLAGFFKKKKTILNYHYASNPIEVMLNDDRVTYFRKIIKVAIFYPEFIFISIAAYFNKATANGPSIESNVPFFLRKKLRVLYESSISSKVLNNKKPRVILKNEKIKFLTVSRLQNGKGLHFALDVFCELKKVRCDLQFEYTIVGDGPLYEDLKKYVSFLSLEGEVKFVGAVANGGALDDFYCSHDIFIMPSMSETGPRVLMEAMSESNLCISSDVGCVNVLLRGNAGLIAKPGSLNDFLSSILWAADNREVAQAMANKSFERSKNYSIESFFEKLFFCPDCCD
ncbi:glycosyltransferase involved in cell wall biosynthesis [Oceanisphaera litoralis]|uniref:glycosyltransferase n=1 Tax=Oceanisphaera litoralis TaxID=225144 RepID=UPI00195D4E98|nr:glycosyltransferase involved in cell wall biosynthesis [Oceanisphaera litoralis]